MSLRGATIAHSGWSRGALSAETWAAIGGRALRVRCHLNVVGKSETGPWTVRAWTNDRIIEHRGGDLQALCAEALDLFEAGVDSTAARWLAGSDGLAHGHVGHRPVWTLCHRPAVGEVYTHPERARCSACLRSLAPAGMAVA